MDERIDYNTGRFCFRRFEFEYYCVELTPDMLSVVNMICSYSKKYGHIETGIRFGTECDFVFVLKEKQKNELRLIEFDYEKFFENQTAVYINIYPDDYFNDSNEQDAYTLLTRDVMQIVLNVRGVLKFDVGMIDSMMNKFPILIDCNSFEKEIDDLLLNGIKRDGIHNCVYSVGQLLFSNQDSELFEYMCQQKTFHYLFLECAKHRDYRYIFKNNVFVVDNDDDYALKVIKKCTEDVSSVFRKIINRIKDKLVDVGISLEERSYTNSFVYGMYDMIGSTVSSAWMYDIIEFVNNYFRADVFGHAFKKKDGEMH